jgi:hypothetical protein
VVDGAGVVVAAVSVEAGVEDALLLLLSVDDFLA